MVGESGIVLTRFLPSDTPAPRSDAISGRTPVRGVVVAAVFEADVMGALVFGGLNVLGRTAGLRSVGDDG